MTAERAEPFGFNRLKRIFFTHQCIDRTRNCSMQHSRFHAAEAHELPFGIQDIPCEKALLHIILINVRENQISHRFVIG